MSFLDAIADWWRRGNEPKPQHPPPPTWTLPPDLIAPNPQPLPPVTHSQPPQATEAAHTTSDTLLPTGAIQTPNPQGRSFGVDWSQITRWRPQATTASAEFNVPVNRLLAHIVIESNGVQNAIQRNASNGDSFGLMQVVPRWWKAEIERLSGQTYINNEQAGHAMINNPLLAIRAGASVLSSFYRQYGTWDAASSGFFTGKPNWAGADTVNGTRGGDYKRTLNGLIAELDASGPVIEPPADPRAGLVHHPIVPGAPNGLWLPEDIGFRVMLTPRGGNRPGAAMKPTGVTQHETGNTRVGTDSLMHANWQNSGTPGHPDGKVGVHFYTDDKQIIQCIPINETSIHSGDQRNQTHISHELCVNSDRNAAKAERNAQYLDATLLRDVIGTTALANLYPHRTGSGCPAIINSRGGWKKFEQDVDALIRGSVTPPPPPAPTYPKPTPLPFPWEGEDVVYNNTDFIALHRTFRAARNGVAVRQFADASAPEIRAPLKKDDPVDVQWVVKANDGHWWVISSFSSRIRADDLLPAWDWKALL